MVTWFNPVVAGGSRKVRGLGLAAMLSLTITVQALPSTNTYGFLPLVGNETYAEDLIGFTGFWQGASLADAYAAEVRFLTSVNNHQRLTLRGRMPGTITGKRDYFESSLYLSRFANEFFGYQAQALSEGERYDDKTVELTLGWSYPWTPQWRGGVSGVLVVADIEFEQPGSPLRTDDIRWTQGGRAMALDFSLTHDTRLQPYWPSRGTLSQATLRLGLDDQVNLIARQSSEFAFYTQLPADVVLALGARFQSATANTPFIYMPTLSDWEGLRGAAPGTYRHRTAVLSQAEARLPVTPRLAATVFVQAGQTGAAPSAWWDRAWVQGGGAGLRYSLSAWRRHNLRVDMGWVNGDPGVVVNFGEAF